MSHAFDVAQRWSAQSASRPRKGADIALIVLHSDPRPAAESLAAYTSPDAQTAPHYYIDAAGTITQLVPEQRAAHHSGKATWKKHRRNIDRISVGITLEHTPGARYGPAQLDALHWLIGKLRANHGLGEASVVSWEALLPGTSTADGVVVPVELPPPVAAPTEAAPVVLGEPAEEQVVFDEGIICGGIAGDEAAPAVLGDEHAEHMPGPMVLGDVEGDPAAVKRLWSFLQGETYRQRGEGFRADWSFHQYATKNNLGAPIAPSAQQAKQVQLSGGQRYGYQPFACDTLFNEIPKWDEIRSLNSALGGRIPASGLERLILEASYGASGAALHDNQAFHQLVVRDRLGVPLGSGYSLLVSGRKFAVQVFSCDTLYTPFGVPEEQTNWGDVRRLSDEPAGELREVLWAETYKICGAAYQPDSPFQQFAAREKLGAPLTGVYSVDFEGHPYTMQVFACDTLYAAQDGAIKRLSALSGAEATAPPQGDGQQGPVQTEQGSLDDALSDKRHTFHVLPFASWPLIGQPYGYTRFAIKNRDGMYKNTQGRHSGIDFMVPVGTQLLSVSYGLVVAGGVPSTKEAPFGGCPPKVIIVRYGNVYAIYGHASEVLARRGQFVKPGDVLGLSGSFNGPHLHFEVRPVPANLLGNRDPGQPAVNSAIAVNPLTFFSPTLDSYFDQQYARLRGTLYDFCCDTFRNQPDTHFGQPVDTRSCSN